MGDLIHVFMNVFLRIVSGEKFGMIQTSYLDRSLHTGFPKSKVHGNEGVKYSDSCVSGCIS